MPLRFALAARLALLAPVTLLAQEELPEEIAQRKAAFEKEIASVVAPIDDSYKKALQRLEREFALAKDYEAAIAARDERKALERSRESGTSGGGTVPAGTGEAASVAATPATGEGSPLTFGAAGSSSLDGALLEEEALRFGKAEDAAAWTMGGVDPGAYEVVLSYAAAAASTVKVQEYFFRLSGELPATGGESEFSEHSLGILKVTSRATSIRLTAGGPFLLKEIRLVPR